LAASLALMTEISFYHLTKTPLDKALPRLLEKVLGTGKRAVVLAAGAGMIKTVDKFLWSYKPESFLAHGTQKDDHADKQPIYLTTEEENPNNAAFLVMLEGVEPGYATDFERCLDVFDGHDEAQVQSARERWKVYKAKEGVTLSYWKQDASGRWEKAA
jgi:DNA polymerase-3 subunit chi